MKPKSPAGPSRKTVDTLRDLIDPGNGTLYRTVISGGTAAGRNAVLTGMITLARKVRNEGNASLPTLILHQRNELLQRTLCEDGKNVRLPGGERCVLNPLGGFSDDDIALLLQGAAEKIRPARPELKSLISLGIRFLRAQDKQPTLWELCRIQWSGLSALVEEMNENGDLRPKDAREFLEILAFASSELGNADMFFSALRQQLGSEPPEEETVGLNVVMKQNGYACLDLIGGEAKEMKSLWFKLLRRLTLTRRKFLLVLDSLPVDEELVRLMEDLGNSCILCHPDLPAAAGEQFFRLVGGNTNLAVLAHQNAKSAEAVSDFFGKRYQMKYSESSSTTRDRYKVFSTQTTTGSTREAELRYRIPTETIQDIPERYMLLHGCSSAAEPRLVSLEQMHSIRFGKNVRWIEGGR